MKQYNTYSTAIKFAYALGLQNEWIPEHVRERIPGSTANHWKNHFDANTVIRIDANAAIDSEIESLKEAYHPLNAFPRKLFFGYCKIVIGLVNLLDRKVLQSILHEQKEGLIDFLELHKSKVSYKGFAKLVNIELKTLYHWRNQVKYACEHSIINLCLKTHPNQASSEEIKTIERKVTDPDLAHWSLHAIWAQSFKSGETRLSKQTWYHYNKLMRFRVNSKKGKRPKRKPLRASCVNEIWHADITVFKTLDGVKHYIYTVMDNYSRFIHAWHIDTVVSAEICRNTLHQGIKNAFDQQPVVLQQLVTDGGPENDNFTVKNFLNENGVKHSIALRDIAQSNSMMEAFYSTAKYRYLYQQKIENGTELKEVFEKFLDEYHYKKPHYALGIYTPSEVLLGQNKLVNFREIFAQAAAQRRQRNRSSSCSLMCH